MALYVLKTFDPTGRLIERSQFRAPGDEEAASAMPDLPENRWCELWRGSRVVRVWDGALRSLNLRRSRPAGASSPSA